MQMEGGKSHEKTCDDVMPQMSFEPAVPEWE
jgi:hypothetical protein